MPLAGAPDWLASQERALAPVARQLRAGRVLPFVGAGTSIGLGMPSWGALVEHLRAAAQREAGGAAIGLPSDPLLAAELCKQRLGPRYGAALASAFALDDARRAAIEASAVFRSLAALPCLFWLTTNYDAALEHALSRFRPRSRPGACSFADDGPLNGLVMRRHDRRTRPLVVHLHGRLAEPDGIVLTEDDYQRRYWWAGTDRMKMATLFATFTALFVGCSMTDEDLRSVLREVKARFRFAGGQHLWLRGVVDEAAWGRADEREAHAALWRTKFGVDVVDYPAFGHDHGALATALDAIHARAIELGATRARATAGAATAPGDPNRGQFGGARERSGYRLEAALEPVDGAPAFRRVRLAVVRAPGAPSPREVAIHLTEDYTPRVLRPRVEGGAARVEVEAFAPFTVGAEVRARGGRPVLLEIDLAGRDPTGVPFAR
jgi:hypothetical protein